MLRVTGRGVCRDTPLLDCLGGPEASQGGVPIDVSNDEVRTTAVDGQAVVISEVRGAPAITSLDPSLQPMNGFLDVEPIRSYQLWIGFVNAAIIDSYPQFHR